MTLILTRFLSFIGILHAIEPFLGRRLPDITRLKQGCKLDASVRDSSRAFRLLSQLILKEASISLTMLALELCGQGSAFTASSD